MPKNALAQILLEFGRTPGRYALRLREPAELHAQMDTLVMWALGRVPEELQEQAQDIKAAAVMFIQRVCFAPENNHYQILGLPQGPVDADLLRTRYRALIRLTHPDMGVEGLAANAAGLVNRAQKVLADPALRARYDQELENEAWPRWRTAPPIAATAGAPLVRKPEAHWAAPEPRLALGEGWSALWARYSLQARLLLTATGVGALVVALLAWAAHDAPSGAMLVVARAPSTAVKPDAARPSTQQAAERTRTEQPGAVPASSALQALAAANQDAKDSADLHLSRDMAPSTGLDARPSPIEPARAKARKQDTAETANAGTRVSASTAGNAPAGTTPAGPAPAGPAPAVATPSVVVPPPPRPQPSAEPDYAALAQAQVQIQAKPTTATVTRAARADNGAATPVSVEPWPTPARPLPAVAPPMPAVPTAAATPPLTATPTPAPPAMPTPQAPALAAAPTATPAAAATPAPQWSVDAPGATQYLRDLMATLERPRDAQRAQELLRKMDVNGNLLAPGLRLAYEYPRLKVTSVTLSESPRPSALEVRGTVQVTASNPQTATATTVRYRLAANFIGTPEGTAMSRLELVETE